jgi:HKD family nuclease
MAVFTNSPEFGGEFLKKFETLLNNSSGATIAVGYTSAESIERISARAKKIVDHGGIFRLLVGLAFFEGTTKPNYESLLTLHSLLKNKNKSSGVKLSCNTPYHGKIYSFYGSEDTVIAGSANLSPAGMQGNFEYMSEIRGEDVSQTRKYLDFLLSEEQSAHLDKIQDLIIRDTADYQRLVKPELTELERYKAKPPIVPSKFIEIPFEDIDTKQRSGLNACFGKGRLQKNGNISPRPWFEVEIIAKTSVTSKPNYPKGDFRAFTDDGYIIECKTGGDYNKNLRSKKNLQILGKWIKGKLQNKGVLAPFSPITNETLLRYGKTSLRLYPAGNGDYYLEF